MEQRRRAARRREQRRRRAGGTQRHAIGSRAGSSSAVMNVYDQPFSEVPGATGNARAENPRWPIHREPLGVPLPVGGKRGRMIHCGRAGGADDPNRLLTLTSELNLRYLACSLLTARRRKLVKTNRQGVVRLLLEAGADANL